MRNCGGKGKEELLFLKSSLLPLRLYEAALSAQVYMQGTVLPAYIACMEMTGVQLCFLKCRQGKKCAGHSTKSYVIYGFLSGSCCYQRSGCESQVHQHFSSDVY